MRNLFLALFGLFILSACGKLVSDVHPDFIGTWISTDLSNRYILVIAPDNAARFDRIDVATGDTITTNLGTARINSSDRLIIGNLKLKISEYPTFDSQTGEWTCRLENWPFLKE